MSHWDGVKPLKIISLPVDQGGCGWYRIRQPFEMIKRFTPHDVHIVDSSKDDMVEVTKAMSIADVVVVRQGGEVGINELKTMPEFKNLKWILDIDDNIECIDPYSEHYSEYGTKEFIHNDNGKKIKLWEDGVNIDLKKNIERIDSLIQGLRDADLVTVTTEKLREYALQYNKNVAVLPNCINFERWWKLPLKQNKKLRIGWSGGISHYRDWYTIKEPLNQLMREYDFTLVMIGAEFKGIVDKDNQDRLEVHDWTPFKGHSYRMMCMNLDIALIPLEDMEFNQYKSSIKFLEMSAMGVPSVVPNILPYSEDINENNAFIYSTTNDFYKQLKSAIEDKKLRSKIGENAMKYVKENYCAKSNVNKWINAYSSIL